MPLSISDLFQAQSAADVKSTLLDVLTALGIPITSWQPLAVVRSIVAAVSQKIADLTAIQSQVIQGGFLDTAALVTPEGGPGWLDILAQYLFGIERAPATFAAGDVTIVNASGTTYTPNPKDIILSNPITGKTYRNATALTITAHATLTGALFEADEAGAASSSGPGTITNMVTPLSGCTVSNPASLLGSDPQTNADLVSACHAKLSALAFGGPEGAYDWFAKFQDYVGTPIAGLSLPITRSATVTDPTTGKMVSYIANATGAPSGGDVTLVAANQQKFAVPQCVTLTTAAAATTTIPFTYTAYIKSAAYTSAQVAAAVATQLGKYFASLPIGGYTAGAPNQVTVDALIAQVFLALPAGVVQAVTVTSPTGPTTLASNAVAVLGTVTPTIVFV